MATTGTCTWEYNSGTWTIIAKNCTGGHLCASGLTPAQSVPGGGTSIPDSVFRDELNKAFKLATGLTVDVISRKLTLANGTKYVMDCV